VSLLKRARARYRASMLVACAEWLGCFEHCHCADYAHALSDGDYGHDPDMCCPWCTGRGLPPYDARITGALPGEGMDL
jgi:hypothetical protein